MKIKDYKYYKQKPSTQTESAFIFILVIIAVLIFAGMVFGLFGQVCTDIIGGKCV